MYETIRFYAVGTALVVAGVVAGILFGGVLAALIVPLHLEGTLASISGVLTLAAFFGPVFVVPIVGIRRLRLRIPPDDPEPPTQRPARRSDAAIRADVQRLDARLDPGAVDDLTNPIPGVMTPREEGMSGGRGERLPQQHEG